MIKINEPYVHHIKYNLYKVNNNHRSKKLITYNVDYLQYVLYVFNKLLTLNSLYWILYVNSNI